MRIAAAISGGVDSAVAAARLIDAGHEVTGVHLILSNRGQPQGQGCASPTEASDAAQTAQTLGIPFESWDLSERFATDVVADFVSEYAAGRTPNPCLRCNERIKFAAMLERALECGFDALATGHYARIVLLPDGPRLARAIDHAKDQSYVLGGLTTHQISHAIFPLGESTKADIRAEAEARGLTVASKPDSTDICFIPDGDSVAWLADRFGPQPGDIVDDSGRVIGQHSGTYRFTIGQRRGLHLKVPAADGQPRFVTGVEPATGLVRVGPRHALRVVTINGIRPTWAGPPRTGPWRGLVQLRAHAPVIAATIDVKDDRAHIVLDEPVEGLAPGQGAVYYDEDIVVGSCIVDSTGGQT